MFDLPNLHNVTATLLVLLQFIKELVNTTCLQRYMTYLVLHLLHLGSLCASRLTSVYGRLSRKRCLLLNNLFVIDGAVMMLLSKTAMSFEMIIVGHFLYGINAGVSLSLHTMYLMECTP
ncbi:unnamed protein product [Coregonus sp. 'balchen']|nr:unnamed protein product [Coregonus sp. 'balchen']